MKPNVWLRTDSLDTRSSRISKLSKTLYLGPNFYHEPSPPNHIPLDDIDVIVTFGVHDSLPFLERMPNVAWIHSLSVGVEALRFDLIQRRNIVVTNSRGCTAVPIAEHVLAAILGWARGLPQFYRLQRQQRWKGIPVRELADSVVGIVGYGSIGKEIAKRCKALGMTVIACRNRVAPDPDVDEMLTPQSLNKLLQEADFVVNCLPASSDNIGYFDAHKFARMRSDAVFINVGRGLTVDENALVEALRQRRIEGAILDVFSAEPLPAGHPLWTLDNVVITPHHSYASPRNAERLSELFEENLTRYVRGLPLLNVVDVTRGY